MTCRSYPLALVFVGACALLVGACGGSEPPAATVNQLPGTCHAAARGSATCPGTRHDAITSVGAARDGLVTNGERDGRSATAQPIAVEDYQEAGVQVALLDVRRTSGDTVTVRLQVRNTNDKAVTNADFSSSNFVNAMYLIDGGSKKKYLVVRDADNKPVGFYGQSQTIPAKGTLSVWASFQRRRRRKSWFQCRVRHPLRTCPSIRGVMRKSCRLHRQPDRRTDSPRALARAPAAGQDPSNEPPPASLKRIVLDLKYPVVDLKMGASDTAGAGSALAGKVEALAIKETPTEVRIELAADVLFDFDKAEIRSQAADSLKNAAAVLREKAGGPCKSKVTPTPRDPTPITRACRSAAPTRCVNGWSRRRDSRGSTSRPGGSRQKIR